MSERRDPRDDDRLIETIGAAYAPRRLEPSRRVALEQQLWARIEKRRRLAGVRPLATAVTFAAAVLWFAPIWLGRPSEPPKTTSETLVVAAVDDDAWEFELLYPEERTDASLDVDVDDDPLPEDYRAIEVLLVEG